MMKKLAIFLTAFILFVTMQPFQSKAAWSNTFYDVYVENQHYSNILYLAEKNIIKGYTMTEKYDGSSYSYQMFKPSNNVTNSQVATMLVRALDLGNTKYTNPGYKDITTKHSAYKEIAIATKLGFFPKSTYFNPNKPITREVMAYALTKAFNLNGTSSVEFKDVSPSTTYYSAIQALAANNITTGDNGLFKPKKNLTRAQFASFLTRALVPEARPTNNSYNYNQKLVPTNYGSSYTYKETYEGYSFKFDFDSVYNNNRYEDMHMTIMEGVLEDLMPRIEYYEDQERFTISANMGNAGASLTLPYPFKTGTTYQYKADHYDSDVQHKVKVVTTNGLYKVGGNIYKDVIIVTEEIYFEDSSYPMYATFMFRKSMGLLHMFTEAGEYDLVKIVN